MSSAGQVIFETAKQEGGPQKGSASAQMQSEVVRQRNFEQAAAEVGSKVQNAPESVTSEDAAHIHSREAKVTGVANPPKGSLSSQAESLAAANEGRSNNSAVNATAASSNPTEQAQQDRMQNFEHASKQVASKMANNPEQVTKEEGDLLHSREQRAFGTTSKGGVASQAQSLAAENEKAA
ncbi:hypothetical protein LTR15_005847 [Elasticomyces elasticus]|nr:hypothetical protein LTR15_005847 [Elasticomyces elasticus]